MMHTYIKTSFFIPFILLFAGVLFLQSCDHPSSIAFPENEQQGTPGIVSQSIINTTLLPALKTNNTLAFDSFEQFGQFMNEFGKEMDIEPDTWVEQTLGFSSSLQSAQNKEEWAAEAMLGQNKENTRQTELVPDPWFASVLNEEGLIEVENMVFQITEHHTVIYIDWEAYHSFSPILDLNPAHELNKNNSIESNNELEKINDSVYLFKIQGAEEEIYDPGDGGGNGGGGNGWCCPSKKTAKYRSGGKDGRLLGKSWNINYGLYSSFGSKSKHQRKGPLGIGWIARTANQLWLDSETVFSYKRSMPPTPTHLFNELSTLGQVSYGQVESLFLQAGSNPPSAGQATGSITNLTNGHVYEVTIQITNWSSNSGMKVEINNAFLKFSGSENGKKTVKKVYDRDSITGSISSDGTPNILGLAGKFDIQYIDGHHKLLHDGHTREFQTRKGSIE